MSTESVCPAPGRDAPLAHVAGDDQLTRVAVCELGQPVPLLERASTDDHARRTRGEQILHVIVGANASAHLHRHVRVSEHVADEREVRPTARRCVEIDEVQSPEPIVFPTAHHVGRVRESNTLIGI